MITTGADALGLDWTTPLNTARTTVTGRVALQGTLTRLFYMVRRLQLKSCKGNVRRCLRKR
ncbi:uroporphyrinogen decarboxylase family protein [Acinetobacter baumannii]